MAKLTKQAAVPLREHLAGQPPERLAELVVAEVERNPALKDELLLEVAPADGPLDLAQSRRSFSDALRSKSAAGGRSSYARRPRRRGRRRRLVQSRHRRGVSVLRRR